MPQVRFTESCVLTGFLKPFKGSNFVASRKTHWLTSLASTDDFTRSKHKKLTLAETVYNRDADTYIDILNSDIWISYPNTDIYILKKIYVFMVTKEISLFTTYLWLSDVS